MYRTFNCGIGMTVCVAAEHCERALKVLREQGEQPSVIGEVRRGDGGVIIRDDPHRAAALGCPSQS